MTGDYSSVAAEQLDRLESEADDDLWNALVDACELVLRLPAEVQRHSSVIRTDEGLRFRLPVAGHPPWKVFWSRVHDGTRVEAVVEHP